MKIKGMFFVVICLLLIAQGVLAFEDTQSVVIRAARMLDVETGKLVENAVIVIEGDLISAVSPKEQTTNAKEINLGDVTLLPGLIDAHTHITFQLNKDTFIEGVTMTPADNAFRSVGFAGKTLLAGFTTIRDLGSYDFVDISLKNAVDSGLIEGPRIIPAGHAIGITGGHGDATGFIPGVLDWDWRKGVADGVDEVTKSVRYQIKYGAQVVKIMATAGVLSFDATVGAQQMSEAEMRAAVEEASRHGLKVAAHAHGTEGIIAAIRAGVSSIEHGSILNDEAIALMKEKGTYLVPTVYLTTAMDLDVLPPSIRVKAENVMPIMRNSLKKAIAEGVKIAFGTDAGVYPHGDNAHEFAELVKLGMTPIQAIQAATVNAADLLGVSDRGTIAAGRLADIIAVNCNPLEDVKVLEDVQFVMKGGIVYKYKTDGTK